MKRYEILVILIIVLLFSADVLAQTDSPFAITWFSTTSGGQSQSSDGGYVIHDAIGADVVDIMGSTSYTVTTPFAEPIPVKNLVLLYVSGDNNLKSEVREMVARVQAGAVNADAVTMMVLDREGENNSDLYLISRIAAEVQFKCNLYDDRACGGQYEEGRNLWKFKEALGDPAVLEEFLVTAITKYPNSQRILLSLVGHGGGWSPRVLAGQPPKHAGQPGIGGLLWDDFPGTSLNTIELGTALRKASETTKRQIDLLYLDACLMGMWEVAYEVRESVHYFLASESWSWTSFAYDRHLSSLHGLDSIPRIAQQWIQNEADVLGSDDTIGLDDDYPYTYSLLDVNQITGLTSAINGLSGQLQGLLPARREAVGNAFKAADCLDSDQDYAIDHVDSYCDLLSFAHALKEQFRSSGDIVTAADGVIAAIDTIVINNDYRSGIVTNPEDNSHHQWTWVQLGGISIYTPFNPEQDDWKRRYYEQLQSSANEQWDEVISAFWRGSDLPAAYNCGDLCDIPPGPISLPSNEVFLPWIVR